MAAVSRGRDPLGLLALPIRDLTDIPEIVADPGKNDALVASRQAARAEKCNIGFEMNEREEREQPVVTPLLCM